MRTREIVRSQQCSATSKRSGEQCRRLATKGTHVCMMHGAASARVKTAAAKRVALAEALARGEKRHPWEVLEDALHSADTLMADAMAGVQAGQLDAALVDKFVAAIERAHRMAKVNLDAGIDQRKLRLAEAQAGQMHQVFTRVLAQLGLTAEQKARVPELLKREIKGVLEIEGTAKAV